MAYGSNSSGRDEVYIRPFGHQTGGRIQVSVDGGSEPVWSHSGRELFYRAVPRLVAATIDTTGEARVVSRTQLFSLTDLYWYERHHSYAVSRDDQSFYFAESLGRVAYNEWTHGAQLVR